MGINQVYAQFEASENEQRNMLYSTTIAYFKADGHNIGYNRKQVPEIKILCKEAEEALAEENKTLTLENPALSQKQYFDLVRKGHATKEDHQAHLRWQIEDITGSIITSELYDRYHKLRDREALNTSVYMFLGWSHQQEFDSLEIQKKTLFKKRSHIALRCQIMNDVFSAVAPNGFASDWQIIEEEISDLLKNIIKQRLPDIKLYIDKRSDLSEKPLNVLRRLFKHMGVKLGLKQVMRDGKRFYIYFIDQEVLKQLLQDVRQAFAYKKYKAKNGKSSHDYSNSVLTISIIQELSNEILQEDNYWPFALKKPFLEAVA